MSTLSFFFDSSDTNLLSWCHSACPCDLSNLKFQDGINFKKNDIWKNRKIIVLDQYLICQTKDNHFKWMNYENSSLRVYYNQQDKFSCLELSYGDKTIVLGGEIENMIETLRHYSVQQDFQKNYKLQKRLGRGSFAEVFSAKNKRNDEECAIKIFDKPFYQDGTEKLSLLKEISILRKLTHESSVRLLEVYETSICLYLVLEKIQGGCLRSYLDKNAPLSEKQTQKLVYRLLQSLNHIHQLNIFHRDLKPENILFREKDNLDSICITDFGLADFYNPEGNYIFTRCGSPGFVAPEVLHDQIYDFKVDVYSVGIIMYYAICGNFPFSGENTEKRVELNYIGEIKFSKLCMTTQGMNFLQDVLSFYPANRINLAQALMHCWFQEEKLSNKKEFKIRQSLLINKEPFSPQIQKKVIQQSPRTPISLKPMKQIIQEKRVSQFKLDDISKNSIINSSRERKSIPNQQAQVVKKSIFKYLEPLNKKALS